MLLVIIVHTQESRVHEARLCALQQLATFDALRLVISNIVFGATRRAIVMRFEFR